MAMTSIEIGFILFVLWLTKDQIFYNFKAYYQYT